MNKTELIAAVAEKTGMSKKDTEAVIAATLGTITAALHEEEKVQLMGFGSFEVKKRAARTGRNPRSKETIEIPASQTPVFKAGKALKDAVGRDSGRESAGTMVGRHGPRPTECLTIECLVGQGPCALPRRNGTIPGPPENPLPIKGDAIWQK